MNKTLIQVINGIIFAVTSMVILFSAFWLTNAAWQNTNPDGTDSNLYASGSVILTTAKWNALVEESSDITSSTNSIESTISIATSTINDAETAVNASYNTVSNADLVSNTIMAFYLTTCPSGWSPADGTNGNPDLRGQFVRGLNTFDGGVTTRSDGYQDTDSRSLGDYQADENKAHNHYLRLPTGGASSGGGQFTPSRAKSARGHATNNSGTEARPKNVAVIYCVKD